LLHRDDIQLTVQVEVCVAKQDKGRISDMLTKVYLCKTGMLLKASLTCVLTALFNFRFRRRQWRWKRKKQHV